jgi:membrane carboxypeptidase/penicillin-binding protein
MASSINRGRISLPSYGVSNAASPSYNEIVKSFSSNEVKLMLDLPKASTVISKRISSNSGCQKRFRSLVALVDAKTVPTASKSLHAKWLPKA